MGYAPSGHIVRYKHLSENFLIAYEVIGVTPIVTPLLNFYAMSDLLRRCMHLSEWIAVDVSNLDIEEVYERL